MFHRWVFDRTKLFYGCFGCSNGVLVSSGYEGILEVFERCSAGSFGSVLDGPERILYLSISLSRCWTA